MVMVVVVVEGGSLEQHTGLQSLFEIPVWAPSFSLLFSAISGARVDFNDRATEVLVSFQGRLLWLHFASVLIFALFGMSRAVVRMPLISGAPFFGQLFDIILLWSRSTWSSIWHHLAVVRQRWRLVVIYLTSSCCGQEVRGHLSDIILLWSEVSLGVVVIYLSSSCCGQEVRGHLFDILLWFVEGLFGGGGVTATNGAAV